MGTLVKILGFRKIKAGISLYNDHNTQIVFILRLLETLSQEGNVCSITSGIFRIIIGTVLYGTFTFLEAIGVAVDLVVVATWNIQSDKYHLAITPTGIFRVQSTKSALVFELHSVLPEAPLGIEHGGTQKGQSFQVIIATVIGAMAVGPFIVAGNIHHRRPEFIKTADCAGILRIVTYGTSVLDITVKYGELDPGCIDVGDQGRNLSIITVLCIRHIAPESKTELACVIRGMLEILIRNCGSERQYDRQPECNTGRNDLLVFHLLAPLLMLPGGSRRRKASN